MQSSLETLPVETLVYLLGSRYCDTDRLSEFAWSEFGKVPKGWPLVQAICDFVHDHITFGYAARQSHQDRVRGLTRTRQGVCRDFAHLAITLCRCMNVPARYCTGYLGDIGVPPDPHPMDFSAWFEVYLGGRWYTFDARHNTPRIGRILIARGRDATDVAITTSYGLHAARRIQGRAPTRSPRPRPRAPAPPWSIPDAVLPGQAEGNRRGDRGLPGHEQQDDGVEQGGRVEQEPGNRADDHDRHPRLRPPDGGGRDAGTERRKPGADGAGEQSPTSHPSISR